MTDKDTKRTGEQKAKFITIERPLLPAPPIDGYPYWCYANTLMFKEHGTHKTLWQQDIPEAELMWCEDKATHIDRFDNYFRCEVFKDDHFGWQLRMILSHEIADMWHKRMLAQARREHNRHFKKKVKP